MMPSLIALHSLEANECVYDEDGVFLWPPLLSLNFDSIADPKGIYLLDNGIKTYILLNFEAEIEDMKAIFGVEDLADLDVKLDEVS